MIAGDDTAASAAPRRPTGALERPGVHVRELTFAIRPISGAPTSVAGFVGQAVRGPVDPRVVDSPGEFERLYGGTTDASFLAQAVRGFFENGGRRCHVARVEGAAGKEASADDYIGDRSLPPGGRTGLAALEGIDEISLLCAPDEVRRAPNDLSRVTAAVVEQCERRRDRMGILAMTAGQGDPRNLPPLPNTSWAALYHPWIEVPGLPRRTSRELVPASGHVAGVFARVAEHRGVHKAPAGEELRGVTALELDVTDAVQAELNPLGINCLRDFRTSGRGIVVWGARTLAPASEWRFVNVRRLSIFIEESIEEGLEWVVFEPNEQRTWDRIVASVEAFLLALWRDGALLGSSADAAFFVRCDRSTTTQADLDRGLCVVEVGFAPLRPAEFLVLTLVTKTLAAGD